MDTMDPQERVKMDDTGKQDDRDAARAMSCEA